MHPNNIGTIYQDLGQPEKALECFERALAIYRQIGNVAGEACALGNIGSEHERSGRAQKALSHYRKALEIDRRIGDRKGEIAGLSNLGWMYYWGFGRRSKALECFEQALAICREIGDITGEGAVLRNMGTALLSSGECSQAQGLLALAATRYEMVRGQIRSDLERTGFQSTYSNVYAALAATCLAQGNRAQAFEAVERGRARSQLDLLATRRIKRPIAAGVGEDLTSVEQRLDKLRVKRTDMKSRPSEGDTRAITVSMEERISALEKQRLDIIAQLRRADPELGSLIAVDPPSLEEIQSLLSPDVTLVEYFHAGEKTVSGRKEDTLWIFLVTRGALQLTTVPVSQSLLNEKVNAYQRILADRDSENTHVRTTARELGVWLVDPILSLLRTETVIVVPWGPIHKIPPASLIGPDGNMLLQTKRVIVAPSAGAYRYLLVKRASGRRQFLGWGNPGTPFAPPLPGAEREVSEIGRLFPRSSVKTSEAATETAVKQTRQMLGNPDVIHLACHGVFNERVPQLSFLALAADGENDGKLEMHETYGLDWQGVSLVTLSACSSGKGELGAGDDLIGLTRGFMFAGAPSVLCSLWDVDDEATRELMGSFYRNYLAGMSKPEALRQAQIAMLKNPKKPEWSHPFYWSAFVLFGDWE